MVWYGMQHDAQLKGYLYQYHAREGASRATTTAHSCRVDDDDVGPLRTVIPLRIPKLYAFRPRLVPNAKRARDLPRFSAVSAGAWESLRAIVPRSEWLSTVRSERETAMVSLSSLQCGTVCMNVFGR